MFAEKITEEDIHLLDQKKFTGEIIVVNTLEELDRAMGYLKNQKVIGFDTESRPLFKKGMKQHLSLLQLSTDNRAYLIRIGNIGLHKTIVGLFENPDIIKVGAGILEDVRSLNKLRRFRPNNFIDLQSLSSEYGIKDNSLKKITAIVLGFKISKSQRLSNWDREEYSSSQKNYAATDAWVCYEIYKKLVEPNIDRL